MAIQINYTTRNSLTTYLDLLNVLFVPRCVAPLMKGSWQNVIDVFWPQFFLDNGDRSHKWQTI